MMQKKKGTISGYFKVYRSVSLNLIMYLIRMTQSGNIRSLITIFGKGNLKYETWFYETKD